MIKQATVSNFLACVAILLAALQIYTNKYFGEIAGAFDKPELSISFGTLPLNPVGATQVIYGTRLEKNDKCLTLGALPIVVSNSGKTTIEALVVVIRTHKILNRDALNVLNFVKEGPYQSFLIKGDDYSDEVFNYVSYKSDQLNLGMNEGINEPFVVIDSNIEVETHAKTSDGVGLRVFLRGIYSNQYLITLTAKDVRPIDYFGVHPILWRLFDLNSQEARACVLS
jgi:hypothetical protein